MVRYAEEKDIDSLAAMLRNFTQELWPEHYCINLKIYKDEIFKAFENPKDTIFIDSRNRGFAIVRDDTEMITPTMKRYNPYRIYIKPKYRGGRLLSQFYEVLFEKYSDGEIWGLTEANSKHIPVLEKRYKRIANIYDLNKEV